MKTTCTQGSQGWLLALGMLWLAACGSDWMEIPRGWVEGMVHKGPFVQGSGVRAFALDASGQPIDSGVATSTSSDLGAYRVEIRAALVSVQAEGQYFNEITGTLSNEPLLLKALTAMPTSGTQRAHINLITHVCLPRALHYWTRGEPIERAMARAEDELRVALRLVWPAGTPLRGADLSLLSPDPDQRAYLWAVTLQYLLVAESSAGPGGSAEAQLQSLLDDTAQALRQDGRFGSAQASQFSSVRTAWAPDKLATRLQAYLAMLGQDVAIPELQRVLDSDGDGIANASDSCPLAENPNQAQRPLALCGLDAQERLTSGSSDPASWSPLDLVDASGQVRVLYLSRSGAGDVMAQADAQGRFGAFVPYSLPAGGPSLGTQSGLALALPDVNGDGASDLLVSTPNGSVSEGLYLSGGSTGFAAFVPTTSMPYPMVGGTEFRGLAQPAGSTAVSVADVDGNGLPDLIGMHTDSTGAKRVAIQLQSAAGSWDPPTLPVAAPSKVMRTLSVGDLNQDGNPDLVTAGLFGAQVLLGDGRGAFSAVSTVTACGFSACPLLSWLVDYDRDGSLDLLTYSVGPTAPAEAAFIGLHRGSSSGQLGALTKLFSYPLFFRPASIHLIDANGDGWLDVLSVEGTDLQLYFNKGGSLVSPQQLGVVTPSAFTYRMPFAVRDLNRDGTGDLLLFAGSMPLGGASSLQPGLVRLLLR